MLLNCALTDPQDHVGWFVGAGVYVFHYATAGFGELVGDSGGNLLDDHNVGMP